MHASLTPSFTTHTRGHEPPSSHAYLPFAQAPSSPNIILQIMPNATWTTELFGVELLIKDGLQPITKVLVDKTLISVYTYDDLSEGLADAVEIVFVSFGKEQDAFDEYYCEMPFAALPFDKTSKQREVVENQMPRLIGHPAVVLPGRAGQRTNEKRRRARSRCRGRH